MTKNVQQETITFIQDMDQAIGVMRSAALWMKESGKNPSKWWRLESLNREFFLRYAKQKEFYVGIINNVPVVAAVLMIIENNQDWRFIDMDVPTKALYIHWLCVDRRFRGRGYPRRMIEFAQDLAKKDNVFLLRLDANADKKKLQDIYENLGFKVVRNKQEETRTSAFYQKKVI